MEDRIFVEQLLSEVQNFPCIYAIRQADYKDVGKKENAWKSVSNIAMLSCLLFVKK